MHLDPWMQKYLPPQYQRWQRNRTEPLEIVRMQEKAAFPQDQIVVLHAAVEATGRAEILGEILVYASVTDVGRCAQVSEDFRFGAMCDDLWRELCKRRWKDKQHSVHIRRWLGALAERPVSEDLFTEYACEEQLKKSQEAASQKQAESPKRCRVSTWRDRYIFAERDARRINISEEELCWDSPYAEDKKILGQFVGRVSSRKSIRRWAIALHFDRSFDVEAFFHSDGTLHDTARFRDAPTPWHFVYEESGEVLVKIVVEQPDLSALRVERSDDWGWKMISTGKFANMAIFSSRQLGPTEHEAARRAPTEIVTWYLQRCPDAGAESCRGVYGVWRCVQAYQGTMPAVSWEGVRIALAPGMLTLTRVNNTEERFRCNVDESQCTIDLFFGSDEDERVAVHGMYTLEMKEQVLVACKNDRVDGPRPTGPPEGLPGVQEVFQQMEC